MKNLITFLLILIILFFGISQIHSFKRTPYWNVYGDFKYEDSQYLPKILLGYLASNKVKFSLYKLPNYVIDFLKYNGDFSIVYKSKPKFTIIVFQDGKDSNQNIFYSKLDKLFKEYNKNFNLIRRNKYDNPNYVQSYEREAYKDLKLYCGNFCIIDPYANVIFLFKSISFSETEVLEGVLQHFSYMYK